MLIVVKFIRRIRLNAAGHAAMSIPIELFSELSCGRMESISCALQIEDGKLIITPLEEGEQ